MGNVYIRATSADDWAQYLADPVKHWRTGYSAKTLAHCWQDANGFPVEVSEVLASSDVLRDGTPLIVIPEHKVPLPGRATASQNDIWALAKCGSQLVSIAVEGKVAEPFGDTVGDWKRKDSIGKAVRLQFLTEKLGVSNLPDTLRYQLLHRTVSALIEAARFNAKHALMLVHSFSPTQQWFTDFRSFASLYGIDAKPNQIYQVCEREGIALHLGWVCGNQEYLRR